MDMVDSGLSVAVSGESRDGAVVVADASARRAVCHHERMTRVRRGGSPAHRLPDEAAVRVSFGTGLDVLVLAQSVLQT